MPAIAIQSKNINGWLLAGIIAGVLAIIGSFAYLIYKIYHLQETLDDITERLNSKPNPKPEKPVIDITQESTSDSECADSNLKSDISPTNAMVPHSESNLRMDSQNPFSELKSEPDFHLTEDFRTVKVKQLEYHVSPTQGRVINRMWEYLKKGMKQVHQDTLLEDLGVCSKKMKDVFKKSPLWKTIVVPAGKGFYRLNLF